jgi:hypothetical protein
MHDLTAITRLSQTLTILSSMIAPVVLILACGSLITITSQRLTRVIERCRDLLVQLKLLVKEHGTSADFVTKEGELLFYLMDKATQRTRLLQKALITLYLSLGIFIATSLSLGILDVINSRRTWLPVLLTLVGALMLFYASVLLIRESAIAKRAINREMDDALLYFKNNLEGLSAQEKRKWWKRKPKKAPAPIRSLKDLADPDAIYPAAAEVPTPENH